MRSSFHGVHAAPILSEKGSKSCRVGHGILFYSATFCPLWRQFSISAHLGLPSFVTEKWKLSFLLGERFFLQHSCSNAIQRKRKRLKKLNTQLNFMYNETTNTIRNNSTKKQCSMASQECYNGQRNWFPCVFIENVTVDESSRKKFSSVSGDKICTYSAKCNLTDGE